MNMFLMKIIGCLFIMLVMSNCVASGSNHTQNSKKFTANKKVNSDKFIIDGQSGSIAGISVGMTEKQIQQSGWPYKIRYENQEGDEYKIYDIVLAKSIILSCTMDYDNKIYRITSKSDGLYDDFSLGINSKLGELKKFYPSGKFIHGFADGRYANFITGTHLKFYFNPDDLDEVCYEEISNCPIDNTIRVKVIALD